MTQPDLEKLARECALDLAHLVQVWFEVSLINPDTGAPVPEFTLTIREALERATKQSNELLAAYRYAVGFYPDDGGYRALKLLNGTTCGKEILDEIRAQLTASSERAASAEKLLRLFIKTYDERYKDSEPDEAFDEFTAMTVDFLQPAMAQQKGGCNPNESEAKK